MDCKWSAACVKVSKWFAYGWNTMLGLLDIQTLGLGIVLGLRLKISYYGYNFVPILY